MLGLEDFGVGQKLGGFKLSHLIIKDLSIEFGGLKVLNNVSFDVPSGSFVGMMGPNGAGKTTVINCISRIYSPSTGQIEFDGQDIMKLSGDELHRMGITRTFQDLNFFNELGMMSVIDYIKLGQFDPLKNSVLKDGLNLPRAREYESELKKNARQILDFFRQAREYLEPPEVERGYPGLHGREGYADLIDAENAPIASLSFAWRRRLDLARALASKPKMLLLDEPAQGLPPSEIDNLGQILKVIQREFKVSALIVEHNVDTLMKISDKIVVLNYGQVITQGLPSEVNKNEEVIELYLGKPKDNSVHVEIASGKPSRQKMKASQVEPILEVKNLDLHYGPAQALFSVSLSVYPQEIVTVLGANGSGKSTLLKAISGTEKASYGEIFVNGAPMYLGWPEASVERGIQYVPQGHPVFPALSVKENLKIGSFILKDKNIKYTDVLDKVFSYFPDLKNKLDSQAGSLSGGQQQMLVIAQAIMGNPKLLLLDEPSLGLAPRLVDSIFEIIQKISHQEKCAVLLVEQNSRKALEISDYVFMMSTGILVGEATAQQLKQDDSILRRYLGFH